MKIIRISAYQVDLPMKEGAYCWGGQSFAAFDSTVVLVETDAGISGVGESCPLGPAYLPAYAQGVRSGLETLSPALIGCDPLQIDALYDRMDLHLVGHPYIKSALDMAFWDILGKSTGLPAYMLLGGLRNERVKLFKVLSRQNPDAMVERLGAYQAQGFDKFQIKVGADADEDIARIQAVLAARKAGDIFCADANTTWKMHEAMRVVGATRGMDYYMEQPCITYEECLSVRRHCDQPMILDECMDSIAMLIRGRDDQAMDQVNLKINRLGGLTKARQFRDLCIDFGIYMTIEDSWGGEISTAAIAHLAHSTPARFASQSSAFHEYTDVVIADGAPEISNGTMTAADAPGLGVIPRMDVLGDPVFVVS
ncbi:MAG: mandelate racemase/muconate lactonizing enzyme family protein [Rhodospirillaceae bacterium]|jgi:cis-L-3-hydroxyproline dehydratase|nr:mandelate racemase/muconate lactonizing enzyme family protein [Rhodospirillaceae bacterium]MBT6512616.1 mandelate racemase/muconate lactonizing enzyme family protein [Rhodospirillaceae bacterium]MBT7613591.1 mandelate racemase/muconate lactonizing enzyme family protein [Rhodospirillaceae bacterium]